MTRPVAVVTMAYGSPASPEEIVDYYTDIRRGRPPTPEQLADLVRRYDAIGGVSPLRQRTEAQAAALQEALDTLAADTYDVILGYKHTSPRVADATARAAADHRAVVGLVLAPHYSALSVGTYLAELRSAVPDGFPVGEITSWATEPAFVEAIAADLRIRLAAMPPGTQVVFTAHSLPQRIEAMGDPYPAEVRATAVAVSDRLGLEPAQWSTAWQSAGRTPEPWLGPDLLEVIDDLAGRGVPGVLVSAVGFTSDHLEVLYDLDIEAAGRARAAGIAFDRGACINADPSVMAALAQRIVEATP